MKNRSQAGAVRLFHAAQTFMMYYIKNLFLLSLFLILMSGCSGSKTVVTPYSENGPEIDGNLTGWNLESSLIERTDVANYYASFDEEYLYLYIDIRSLAHNQAIRQSGLIIYLSSSEENRKEKGIAYPSGTFNLLRENPGTYQSLLNDSEWLQQPQNRQTLEQLEDDIFDRVMIVEESGSDRNHGFIDKDRLQIDGIQIASGNDSRLMSIEMRIPINNQSVYNLSGDRNIWLGFEVSPPNFRIQNDNNSNSASQRGYEQNQGRTQPSNNQRSEIRRRMGQYEEWYNLSLNP
ncbi:MAG: hypothetical protein R6V27_07520 [Balneolaceae bacterium]